MDNKDNKCIQQFSESNYPLQRPPQTLLLLTCSESLMEYINFLQEKKTSLSKTLSVLGLQSRALHKRMLCCISVQGRGPKCRHTSQWCEKWKKKKQHVFQPQSFCQRKCLYFFFQILNLILLCSRPFCACTREKACPFHVHSQKKSLSMNKTEQSFVTEILRNTLIKYGTERNREVEVKAGCEVV